MRIVLVFGLLFGSSLAIVAEDFPQPLTPQNDKPAAAHQKPVEVRLQLFEVRDGKRTVVSRPHVRTLYGQSAVVSVSDNPGHAFEVEVVVDELPAVPAKAAAKPKSDVKLHDNIAIPEVVRRNQEIKESLKRQVQLRFDGERLSAAIEQMSKQFGLNFHLDTIGLEEEGVTVSSVVSINVQSLSLHSTLKLLLEPLRLDFVVENEVIKITSRLRAEGEPTVRTYVVADFVKKHNGEKYVFDAVKTEKLVDLITKTIRPDSWDEAGGPGTIRTLETTFSLVVRASPVCHEELADFLDAARKEKQEQGQRGLNTKTYVVADLTSEKKEDGTTALNNDFALQLVKLITSTVRPETWSERGGPGRIGTPQTGMSLEIYAADATHDEIADLLNTLRTLKAKQAASALIPKTYAVADLIYNRHGERDKFATYELLKQVMSIQPESWDAVGGSGILRLNDFSSALVVQTSQPVHDEIAKLLWAMRADKKK